MSEIKFYACLNCNNTFGADVDVEVKCEKCKELCIGLDTVPTVTLTIDEVDYYEKCKTDLLNLTSLIHEVITISKEYK